MTVCQLLRFFTDFLSFQVFYFLLFKMKIIQITFTSISIQEKEKRTKNLNCIHWILFFVYIIINIAFFCMIIYERIYDEEHGDTISIFDYISCGLGCFILLMDLIMLINLLQMSKSFLQELEFEKNKSIRAGIFIHLMFLVLFISMLYKSLYSFYFIVNDDQHR